MQFTQVYLAKRGVLLVTCLCTSEQIAAEKLIAPKKLIAPRGEMLNPPGRRRVNLIFVATG